jgi:hypothetical protein
MRDAETVECIDAAITFYMQTYDEQDYAFHRAAQLRALYPDARLIVRSDGGGCGPHSWQELAAEFYDEERLFPVANGGRVIHRMLELYVLRPTAYLIKVDPDTVFHRRMHYLPARSGLFGTVQGPRVSRSIQGGFIGLTKTAALMILQSGLLLDSALQVPDPSTGEYMAILRRRADNLGLTSFDCVLGWAATMLGLEIFDFPEVCCEWQSPPDNPAQKYAITHPDPERDAWRKRLR